MSEQDTETGAIAGLALKAAGAPQVVEGPGGRTYLLAPAGYQAPRDITDPFQVPLPKWVGDATTIATPSSLGDYVGRFGGPNTVLFGDVSADRVVAEVDYHGEGAAPGRRAHRAALQLRKSVEWEAWHAIDKKLMDQAAFAQWLEENAADVVSPSGAELLEVARDLHAVRKADFKRVLRANGDERFEYYEGTEAKTKGGEVDVPSKFELNLPVYFGESPVTLYAFLRWRLDEGSLKLGVQLHRAEHVRQAVFQQIVLTLADRTGKPAYFGKAD